MNLNFTNEFLSIIKDYKTENINLNYIEELKPYFKKHNLEYFYYKIKYQHGLMEEELYNNCLLRNEHLNKTRMIDCIRLFSLLSKNNINFAVLKGAYLTKKAYGTIGLRCFNDIDILVSRSELDKVIDICVDEHYLCGKYDESLHAINEYNSNQKTAFLLNTHQAPTMVKLIHGDINVTLDINFSLFWEGYDGLDILINDFINECNYVDVIDDCDKIPVLKNEEYLLQLCLHTYKESNGYIYLTYQNGMCIRAFLDIYLYIEAIKNNFNLNKFMHLVDKYKLHQIVYFVFYYIKLLFHGNSISKTIYSKLYNQDFAESIHYFGIGRERRVCWGDISPSNRFFLEQHKIDIYSKLNGNEIEKLERIRSTFY